MSGFRFTVLPEDQIYARRQDRYNCAIVRAIQREYPDATFVRADTEVIAFSEGNHRYVFDTPARVIDKLIKPFDEGDLTIERPIHVTLAVPTIKQLHKRTEEEQNAHRKAVRTARARKPKTSPGNPSNFNRFCEPAGPDAS